MKQKQARLSRLGTGLFSFLCIVYVLPIVVVLMNSFKKKSYISLEPFQLPNETTLTGLDNYTAAIDQYGFLAAVGWTVFITVGSVLVILICTSMCARYITRVKTRVTKAIYILCVFSMVVPFQMVMFTLSLVTDRLGLGTPWGLIIIYLGFGAGLAVFMAVNMLTSALALARYDARTSGEAPNGQLEVFLDEHFDNARMERIYPNAKKVTKAE